MDKKTQPLKVAVCIATYKRPIGLKRLLYSLRELKFNKSQTPDWFVIIVENDSLMPNKNLIETMKGDFPVPLIYGVETTRGIASTRNRAVQLAGNVDFVAFIDDDEVAEPAWLDELLIVQKAYCADVTTGPVIPRFEQPPPAWILKGHFYEYPRYPTGTEIRCSATNNVLIKSHWLAEVKGPFDEGCNLSGGEDTLFFTQIFQQEAKIVWADEAVVLEFNPPTRISARWLLRRAFRNGIITSMKDVKFGSSFILLLIRVLKGVAHIMIGILLLLPALVFSGYSGFIQGLRSISLGMGEICGLLGIRYQEYKHIHGK